MSTLLLWRVVTGGPARTLLRGIKLYPFLKTIQNPRFVGGCEEDERCLNEDFWL